MPLTTNRALLDRIARPGNLILAWKHMARKRAAGGLDGVSVDDFAHNLGARLEELRRELIDQTYEPQPMRAIEIPKRPGSSETRTLHLLSVRDKVAQEAARAVLEPILDRQFLDCSYGYRPGKGAVRAIARVTHEMTQCKRTWVARADIDDFFGTVDQARLLDRLRGVLREEAVVRLVHLWLAMGAVDGRGRWRDVWAGIGQGFVISPLLANFYLTPFDRFVTGSGHALVRYADDFLVLCPTRSDTEDGLVRAEQYLSESLGLRLNPNPSPVASAEQGFEFLGIAFQGATRAVAADRLGQMRAKMLGVARGPDPLRSVRNLNEVIAGWRQYYGAVLSGDALRPLAELASEGFRELAAVAFERGYWTSIEQGVTAVQAMESVVPPGEGERAAMLERIVHEGRARAEQRRAQTRAPGPDRRPRGGRRRRRSRGHRVNPAGAELAGAASANRAEGVQPAPAVIRRIRRRHHRQTTAVNEVIVDTPGSFIGKSGGQLAVRRERRTVLALPFVRVTSITVTGHGVSFSSDVITECCERGIPVLLVSPTGQVVSVLGAATGLRGRVAMAQLEARHDEARTLDLAKRIVRGKIRNQMALAKYTHKYRKQADPAFGEAFPAHLATMAECVGALGGLDEAGGIEAARGQLMALEARAAQAYWRLVGLALRGKAEFPGRRRQGATDLVNSLLNYGYAVLAARVHRAVLEAGLSPQVSFLHAFQRDGAPALVFDLMEEFRPPVVDRTVLALLNRREPLALDGAGRLDATTRTRLVAAIQDRLATIVRTRGGERKLGEVIADQARRFAAHVEGRAAYRSYAAPW